MELRILALGLLVALSCGLATARSEQHHHNKLLIDAAKHQQYSAVEQHLAYAGQRARNQALRAAARNADTVLFARLAPFASDRGYRHAHRSLHKHVNKKVSHYVKHHLDGREPIAVVVG